MKVLIDIGNTRTKLVYSAKQQLSDISVVDNEALITYLDSTYLNNEKLIIERVVIANVSNRQRANDVCLWAKNSGILFDVVITPKEQFGVINGYEEPKTLGIDRWLAILGASVKFPNKNCLIVDLGTATTIDYLNKNKVFSGGWIIPGYKTMYKSLEFNTANVNSDPHNYSEISLGITTSNAVNLGCWAATIGAMKMAFETCIRQGNSIDQLVLTGGDAKQCSELLDIEFIIEEKLIFHGLNYY